MRQLYNEVAGRDLARLAALSDGIFAFAMTLLVLDIHVPDATAIHTSGDLTHALTLLTPRLVTALMTFLTLGIFWVGQQTHLSFFARGDRNVAWIHIALLFGVMLMPFSTALLASFITLRAALLVYWLNILYLGVVLYASYRYAHRAKLLQEDMPIDLRPSWRQP